MYLSELFQIYIRFWQTEILGIKDVFSSFRLNYISLEHFQVPLKYESESCNLLLSSSNKRKACTR